MQKSSVILELRNNLDLTVQASLLGGARDPMATSANAFTRYVWDLTFENFSGDVTRITIQSRAVGSTVWSLFSVPLRQKSFLGAIEALNTLNLGFFYNNNPFIVTTNDTNEFGDISVLV